MTTNMYILLFILMIVSPWCEQTFSNAYYLSGSLNCVARQVRSFPSRSCALQATNQPLTSPTNQPQVSTQGQDRNDNFIERWLIKKLAFIVAQNSPEPALAALPLQHKQGQITYQDFVTTSKFILHSSSDAKKLSALILSVLKSMFAPSVRAFLKRNIPKNVRFFGTASAWWINCGFLHWLVGPVERIKVVIPPSEGKSQEEVWNSGIKIKQCRYLQEANCKSACSFLCKAPTEQLFNQELGLPVYMKPNFEDKSCEMLFGISPPAPDVDPAFKEPCYSNCPTVNAGLTIPRWRTNRKESAGNSSLHVKSDDVAEGPNLE